MKVLHVSSAKSWRGGEQQITHLVLGLSQLGIEQWVLFPAGAPIGDRIKMEIDKDKNNSSSQNTLGHVYYSNYIKRGSISLKFAKEISYLCRENSIDIIQLHDSHAHTAGVLAQTIYGAKTPMVLTRRVIFPAGKSIFSKWKYNHPSIESIVCISQAVKEEMSKVIDHTSKLVVVSSAIDISRFKNQQKGKLRSIISGDSATPIIGTVGALDKDKNLSLFLETAKLIQSKIRHAQFVIIGKDEGEQVQLEVQAIALGISDSLHFLGFQENVPALLVDFDVFLFTSKKEGLGTSILEAMASGVPTVVTDSGGVRDIIDHGKNGFLIASNDPDGHAKHCITLLENKALRESICQSAHQTLKRFGVDQMASEYLRLYNDLTDSMS